MCGGGGGGGADPQNSHHSIWVYPRTSAFVITILEVKMAKSFESGLQSALCFTHSYELLLH